MKVITWNTQWFKGLDDVVDVSRIVRDAREMADFDVLCLQEVADHYPSLTQGTDLDQPAKLQSLLPGFQVFYGAAIDELSSCGTYRQRFGNLIATRLPALQVQHVPLPYPSPADEVPGLSMPRMVSVCTVKAPWGPVRVMTTHLEYYSQKIRHEQTRALHALHGQFSQLAVRPPRTEAQGPYQAKPHTLDALLCGDFNFEPDSPEYATMVASGSHALIQAWECLHPGKTYPATFRLYDRTYGPEPVACDFFFVSETLAKRVSRMAVNQDTKVSDHQPVLIELQA